jgi:O-antigen/teichoic acid export membrane protein
MARPDTETLPTGAAEAAARNSIGSRIVSGMAWKAASQVTLQVSRMVVALILARQLAPHDFGLAAMVFVFSSFVVVFTDNALGTALIQRRDLTDDDRSTVFWFSAVVGVLLALGGLALSGPLAAFYGEDAVQPLFAAFSIGLFVSALGTTHSALLVRDMQFRRLELRQIAATTVGAGVGVTMAFSDFGAWSIVGQQLAETLTSTVLLWILMPWRPRARVSRASLSKLGGFAGNVFGENLVAQSFRTLNSILIGRFLGAAAVGTYTLANNVILVPFSRIAGPLQQVFFPAFSRMSEDRERLADIWLRATRMIALLAMPALVGLIIVAPDFVHVALGSRWDDATTVIQILGWVGLLASVQTLDAEVLLALDRAGTFFRFTLVTAVAMTAAFVVGMQWGIVGVAVANLAMTLVIEPARTIVTSRAAGISPWRFVRAVSGVAQATALMAAVVLAVRELMVTGGVPPLVRLMVAIAVGALVYLPACLWRAPEVRAEITGVIRRRRHRAPAPAVVLTPGTAET